MEYPYKILILEDESSGNLNNLISEAKQSGLDITHYTDSNKALEEINNDTDNRYDVLICDFELWEVIDGIKVLQYPQGYSFIDAVLRIGRLYQIISFSKMPVGFRHPMSSKTSSYIDVEFDKNIEIFNKNKRSNFILKLKQKATENRTLIAKKGSNDAKFNEFYNLLRTDKRYPETEKLINENSIKYIDQFINEFDDNIDKLICKKNQFGEYIEKFREKYSPTAFEKTKEQKNDNGQKITNEKTYEKNFDDFISCLIYRRIAMCIFGWLEKNKKEILELKCKKIPNTNEDKRKETIGIAHLVGQIIQHGWIDFSITSQNTYLPNAFKMPNNKSFDKIIKTFEEENFLKNFIEKN